MKTQKNSKAWGQHRNPDKIRDADHINCFDN